MMTPAIAKSLTSQELQSAHDSKMSAWKSLYATTHGRSCPTSSRLADELAAIEREMIRRQSAARRAAK